MHGFQRTGSRVWNNKKWTLRPGPSSLREKRKQESNPVAVAHTGWLHTELNVRGRQRRGPREDMDHPAVWHLVKPTGAQATGRSTSHTKEQEENTLSSLTTKVKEWIKKTIFQRCLLSKNKAVLCEDQTLPSTAKFPQLETYKDKLSMVRKPNCELPLLAQAWNSHLLKNEQKIKPDFNTNNSVFWISKPSQYFSHGLWFSLDTLVTKSVPTTDASRYRTHPVYWSSSHPASTCLTTGTWHSLAAPMVTRAWMTGTKLSTTENWLTSDLRVWASTCENSETFNTAGATAGAGQIKFTPEFNLINDNKKFQIGTSYLKWNKLKNVF